MSLKEENKNPIFIGTYYRALDRMRLRLPKKVSHISYTMPALIPSYEIFQDEKERYLLFIPWESFLNVNPEALLIPSCKQPKIDKYGRVVLPELESKLVGIDENSKVAVLGCWKYIEIWNYYHYEESDRELRLDFIRDEDLRPAFKKFLHEFSSGLNPGTI